MPANGRWGLIQRLKDHTKRRNIKLCGQSVELISVKCGGA